MKSSAPSLSYGSALTSVHDYWRNMKFRYFRSDFTEEEAEAQEVKTVPLQRREQGAGTRILTHSTTITILPVPALTL